MFTQQNMTDLVALAAALSLGLILLIWALRGRLRLSPPRCVRCGYDIRSTDWPANPGARCPECGSMLAIPGAVTCAARQIRRITLVVALVLLGAPSFAGVVLELLRPPTPTAPVRVRAAGGPPPGFAVTRPLPSAVAYLEGRRPWEPILKQLAAGEIDSERANKLLEDAAKMLREPSRDAHGFRAAGALEFALECRNRGIVAPDTLRRLLGALFEWNGSLPVKVNVLRAGNWHDDDPISPFELRLQPSLQTAPHFKQLISLRAVYTTSGERLPLWSSRNLRTTQDISDLFSTTRQIGYISVCHSLPPGEHQLRFVFDVGVVPEDAHPRGLEQQWGVASKWPAPGKLWEFEHICMVTIPERSERNKGPR